MVAQGQRLPNPVGCPEPVFKVMQACWQKRPEDRPTFRSLRILLRDAERDVHISDALVGSKMVHVSTNHAGNGNLGRQSSKVASGLGDQDTLEQTSTRVETVILTMQNSLAVARTQEDGARALANLASTAHGRAEIAREGGIETLIASMVAHPKVKQVQECAVAALSNLSASSQENQAKIAQLGGIAALINAMCQHRSKPMIQQYGATALRNLTLHNADNKVAIAREGGISALILAMQVSGSWCVLVSPGTCMLTFFFFFAVLFGCHRCTLPRQPCSSTPQMPCRTLHYTMRRTRPPLPVRVALPCW